MVSLDGDILENLGKMLTRKVPGLTDQDRARMWHEISFLAFNRLGAVDIHTEEITAQEFMAAMYAGYPSMREIKIADRSYTITDLDGLQAILSRDWTNLVPFLPDISDCDDYGVRLSNHLVDFYKITGVIPVWGNTTKGYHGFNLGVLRSGDELIARLVEPQSDQIFIQTGNLGNYVPRETARYLAVMDQGG